MAIITTGNNFGATDAVTSTTLNNIANAATFDDPVDGTSLELKVDGKLGIKDAGVTKAKIENISAPLRVLGRTTAGAGVVEEVTINDEDDMANASAITLATDESIKAYVDEYAMKYSGATGTTSVTTTFADLDLSSVVGANRAMVILELWDASTNSSLMLRPKGSIFKPRGSSANAGYGASGLFVGTSDQGGIAVLTTDASGVIEIKGDGAASAINYKIQAYQKLA